MFNRVAAPSSDELDPPVRSVTPRACARPAPVSPAGQALGHVDLTVSRKNHLSKVLCLCLILAASSSCIVSHYDYEVARATSPSGKVDAVLLETNRGATTPLGYLVYVVPTGASTLRGKRVASFHGASRSKEAAGVNLRWTGPSSLTLEYLAADQQDLRVSKLSVAGEEIHIALRSGVSDPEAPPGGMLYNIVRRRNAK